MAFPFLYSWYRSKLGSVAPIPMVEVASGPQEDLEGCEAMETEEEEDMCWWPGKFMLYYCLAVILLKVIYAGFKKICKKKDCKTIQCKFQREVKGPLRCRCECEATLAFCDLFKKLFGGQQNGDLCVCCCVKKKMGACASNLAQPAFSDRISPESESHVTRKSSQKKLRSPVKEETDSDSGGGGGSISSRKSHKVEKNPKAQRDVWVRQKECPRCKARRTREWLAKHFFDQE